MHRASPLENAAPELRLYLFGTFRLEQDGTLLHLPRRKVQALLAYLVLFSESHAREQLAAQFWGDSADAAARSSANNS